MTNFGNMILFSTVTGRMETGIFWAAFLICFAICRFEKDKWYSQWFPTTIIRIPVVTNNNHYLISSSRSVLTDSSEYLTAAEAFSFISMICSCKKKKVFLLGRTYQIIDENAENLQNNKWTMCIKLVKLHLTCACKRLIMGHGAVACTVECWPFSPKRFVQRKGEDDTETERRL